MVRSEAVDCPLFLPNGAVYVCDVAEAVARAVDGNLKPGTTYELGGPEVKTFRECLEEMMAVTRRQRSRMAAAAEGSR